MPKMAKRLQNKLTPSRSNRIGEIYAIQLKSHFNDDKTRQNDPKVNKLKHTHTERERESQNNLSPRAYDREHGFGPG